LAAAIVFLASSHSRADQPRPTPPKIAYRTAKIDGMDLFFREAGPKDAPAILLLHAYPSSSFMFRNLGQAARREVVSPAARPEGAVPAVPLLPHSGCRRVPLRKRRETALLAEKWRKTAGPTKKGLRHCPP